MPPTPTMGLSKASKRSRSRTGCYTCRRRKKLCDNERPTCGTCNRLGIPCVFPKLYLNAEGDWVPSPQPNGKSKRRASDATPSVMPPSSDLPAAAPPAASQSEQDQAFTAFESMLSGSQQTTTTSALPPWAPPWDAEVQMPDISPTQHDIASDFPNIFETLSGSPTTNGANDAIVANEAIDTTEDGFGDLDDFLKELGLLPSPAAITGTSTTGGAVHANAAQETPLQLELGQMYAALGSQAANTANPSMAMTLHQPTLFRPVQQLAPQGELLDSNVLLQLPILLDYFVNSFSPVISVLGPGENPLLKHLMPLASRSQLVLCALVGWASSHLSILGDPYVAMAKNAAYKVECQVKELGMVEHMTDAQREENMMALLILGGIEVCRGDVSGWVGRLPTTRKLLRNASGATDVATSDTWRSIALNLVYHDVLSALATTQPISLPLDFYRQILLSSESSPDVYMGSSMQIFGLLGEIAQLGSEVSAILAIPPSAERNRQLDYALSRHEPLMYRLKSLDLPASAFAQDKNHLIIGFQAYKFGAQLYLRQVVLRAGPSDVQSQLLAARILSHIRMVLGTPSESQMLFPIFVAGVDTVHQKGREEIMTLFNRFNARVKVGNIQAVFSLLLEVWKRDPKGDKYVDWREIADESEIGISFA